MLKKLLLLLWFCCEGDCRFELALVACRLACVGAELGDELSRVNLMTDIRLKASKTSKPEHLMMVR